MIAQVIIWALVLALFGTNGGSAHLREFAKNSRIFAVFAPGANRAPQFFFPRKSGSQNSTGIRCADIPSTKGDPRL